jgi:hypothetical protein
MQELHVAIEIAPIVLLQVPAEQRLQKDEPLALHVPVAQTLQVAFVAAPLAALYVPDGHKVGFKESNGQ